MEPHDSCARATRGLRRGEGLMVQRRKQEALDWANGRFREIDCEVIGV